MKKYIQSNPINIDFGLLILRLAAGGLMAGTHGLAKLESYAEKSETFLSFMGLSPSFSMSLTIFAEFSCGILIVLGLFTRLAVIPNIIAMLVAVLVAHKDDPFKEAEHALLYLGCYITLLFTGPGKYALDQYLWKKKTEN
ncbi:MAG: DoxX family protein [Bacteroidetes bacterium]|nr:DoxX family protein [Bacteroidota bacterium]